MPFGFSLILKNIVKEDSDQMFLFSFWFEHKLVCSKNSQKKVRILALISEF